MTTTDKEHEETHIQWEHPQRFERPKDRMLKVRNWLNLIFIVLAIAGMVIFYVGNQETGKMCIYIAIAIKFIESAIRLVRVNK